jgi:hypothetical protein
MVTNIKIHIIKAITKTFMDLTFQNAMCMFRGNSISRKALMQSIKGRPSKKCSK